MTLDDAIDAYARAAIMHGAATDRGDHKAANAAYGALARAWSVLRECSDHGRSALTGLLGHDAAHVRVWAATHLLPLDEVAATQVLDALSSEPPFVGFDAKMVLREWKAGRLRNR